MPASRVRFQGGSAAAIVPLTTNSNGELNGAGSAITFDAVASITVDMPFSESGGKEFNQVQLASGVTIEEEKVSTVIDKATGQPKAAGAEGVHKITIGFAETDFQFLQDMRSLDGKYLCVVVPLGAVSSDGFAFLIARPTGSLQVQGQGNQARVIEVEFTGASATAAGGASPFTEADLNAAIPDTLSQVGAATLNVPALVAADMATLLSGKVVLKS